jgi:hypothetical protein
MAIQRKVTEASKRFAERREREDNAPRLAREIPDLVALKLEVSEQAETTTTQPKHIRRVVVAHAPALFLIPCGNSSCTGSEHDLTTTIMRALRSRERTFTGESQCHGMVGNVPCDRTIRFEATAEYAAR